MLSTVTRSFPTAVPITNSEGERSLERFSSKSETFIIGSMP